MYTRCTVCYPFYPTPTESLFLCTETKCIVESICSLFISYTDKYVMHPSFQSFATVNIFHRLLGWENGGKNGRQQKKQQKSDGFFSFFHLWLFASALTHSLTLRQLEFVWTIHVMHTKWTHLNYLYIFKKKNKNNSFFTHTQKQANKHSFRLTPMLSAWLLLSMPKCTCTPQWTRSALY